LRCSFHNIPPGFRAFNESGQPGGLAIEIRGFPTPPRDGCGFINFPALLKPESKLFPNLLYNIKQVLLNFTEQQFDKGVKFIFNFFC
jgi:hypothetical protein